MPTVHSYSVSSVPFYDARQQQYTKILCVNSAKVAGPLAARVKTVRPPRLSGLNQGNQGNHCIHALTSFSGYMTPDDLPELFAFLATNGYTVDLGLTKLAAKHQSNGGGTDANANALVCLVSYTV
jgi:hypothetical protein